MTAGSAPWPARHIGVAIACPLGAAYEFLADPSNFPQWASGLGETFRHRDGMVWSVETPDGPGEVEFSEPNEFGILDHTLTLPGGPAMRNPMRVVASGGGCEVVFTLFRRPGMTEAELARDAEWIAATFRR